MDIFNALLQGFATAITPVNLLWALVGCALGTAVGVLPGIGPAVAVAMLLPITAKVDITASMIFFSGIYYGAMYGGSTTSILLNTPGETASMVTAMEGNKMAKSGRAGAALATAADLAPECARRARHVVEEIARVAAARTALEAGDLGAVGRLLTASHRSSQRWFENSTAELDFLVDALVAVPSG